MDVGVVLAVLLTSEFAILTAREAHATDRDWFAYVLGVGMALPLLLRRRSPTAVLYLVAFVLLLFYTLGYPGFPPALVLAVPLFDATLVGRYGRALPVPVFFLGTGLAVSVREGMPLSDALAIFVPQAAVVVVAMLLGALVRSRQAYAAEVRQRLRRAEQDREAEAQRRVTEERLRIAREVHDTVGHAIATITVQAAAGLDLVERDPDQARTALRAIRGTGKEALAELRTTLRMLRDDSDRPDGHRDGGLHRVPDLLAAVGAAGLRVELSQQLDGPALPSVVDHAAYRILQESLTNVLRHAGARATARVTLHADADRLTIQVDDDGSGEADRTGTHSEPGRDSPGGGRGLVGMRERVESLGGRLTAGPGPDGGFRVRAELPREA